MSWLTNLTWKVCPPVKQSFFFHGLSGYNVFVQDQGYQGNLFMRSL